MLGAPLHLALDLAGVDPAEDLFDAGHDPRPIAVDVAGRRRESARRPSTIDASFARRDAADGSLITTARRGALTPTVMTPTADRDTIAWMVVQRSWFVGGGLGLAGRGVTDVVDAAGPRRIAEIEVVDDGRWIEHDAPLVVGEGG